MSHEYPALVVSFSENKNEPLEAMADSMIFGGDNMDGVTAIGSNVSQLRSYQGECYISELRRLLAFEKL